MTAHLRLIVCHIKLLLFFFVFFLFDWFWSPSSFIFLKIASETNKSGLCRLWQRRGFGWLLEEDRLLQTDLCSSGWWQGQVQYLFSDSQHSAPQTCTCFGKSTHYHLHSVERWDSCFLYLVQFCFCFLLFFLMQRQFTPKLLSGYFTEKVHYMCIKYSPA